MKWFASLLFWGVLLVGPAQAQNACAYRGDLASAYCDANRDLVADMPSDSQRWQDPATLVFSYSPTENTAVHEKLFKPFLDYLGQCVGRPASYLAVQSSEEEIEAMRTGRLHIAGFATGATVSAVRKAGAVPFAEKGFVDHAQGSQVLVIVRKDRPYKKLSDLKGKVVAHVSPISLSGHLVPLALFPKEGLVPGQDYSIIYSGKHDQSIHQVRAGVYEAASVTLNVFERMVLRGEIREDEFRVIYRSAKYPSSAFAHAHDLEPKLRNRLLKCFYDYRFDHDMQKTFDGADRFYPITYQRDYALVRDVMEKVNEAAR
jgi:phosphonate transport system substrate-binding protein